MVAKSQPKRDTRTVVVRSDPLGSTSIITTSTSTCSHIHTVIGDIPGVNSAVGQHVTDTTLLIGSKRELITHETGGIHGFGEVKSDIASVHVQVVESNVGSAHVFDKATGHQSKAIDDRVYLIPTHVLNQFGRYGDVGCVLANQKCINSLDFIQVFIRKCDDNRLPVPRERIAVGETNPSPRTNSTLQSESIWYEGGYIYRFIEVENQLPCIQVNSKHSESWIHLIFYHFSRLKCCSYQAIRMQAQIHNG